MSANIEEPIENNVETIMLNEDNEEKETMEKPKVKKPRSIKQQEALKKAQEKLKLKREEQKKEKEQLKEEEKEIKQYNKSYGLKNDKAPIIEEEDEAEEIQYIKKKKPTKKKKQRIIVEEDSSDSDQEIVISRRRRNKKPVIEKSVPIDIPKIKEPEPEPIEEHSLVPAPVKYTRQQILRAYGL